MLFQTLTFMFFGLLLGALVWRMWEQRELERERAERNAQLAELGTKVDDLAHDLRTHLSTIQLDLYVASTAPPEARERAMRQAQQVVDRAAALLRGVRRAAGNEPPASRSVEDIVRGGIEMARTHGADVRLDVRRPMTFEGQEGTALRVFNNLLTNAMTAARADGGSEIHVEIDGCIRVTNRITGPMPPGEAIYGRGVSGSGSSGVGLAIAREQAAELGWSVSHAVEDGRVTFTVASDEIARTG